MRQESPILILIVGALVLSGCSPARAFPPPNPTAARDWAIHFTQSGGFAGLHLLLEVTSDGTLKAEDKRTGRAATQPVSESTLEDLDDLLRRVAFGAASPPRSGCADCFIYDLEVISGGQRLRVTADDTNLAASGAEELIRYLQKLREEALGTAS